MRKVIAVIDGLGGGIGAQLVSGIKERLGERVEILALGTNSIAAERMLKAGAGRGASGENAIRVSADCADIIMGPIGVVIADSMLGEVTQVMSAALLAARGRRILVPVQHEHFTLAGLETKPLGKLIDEAVRLAAAMVDAEPGQALD